MKRAAVTGIGLLHPLGSDPQTFWTSLLAASPGRTWETASRLGDFHPEAVIPETFLRRMNRDSQMLVMAVVAALADAGGPAGREQIGLTASIQLASYAKMIATVNLLRHEGLDRFNPMDAQNLSLNSGTGWACIHCGLKGYNNTLAGGGALAEAFDALLLGRAQAMVCAGYEEASAAHWQSLPDLAAELPRPLTAGRKGALLSEGAAALFLKPWERGACPDGTYACLAGHAETFDAAGLQAGDQGGVLARAIETALARSGLSAGQVDGVVVSADGGAAHDRREADALKLVFGNELARLPVYAVSGAAGRLEGANEAFGAVVACLALHTKKWPGSPWHQPDPGLPAMNIAAQPAAFTGKTVLTVATDRFGSNQAYLFTSTE